MDSLHYDRPTYIWILPCTKQRRKFLNCLSRRNADTISRLLLSILSALEFYSGIYYKILELLLMCYNLLHTIRNATSIVVVSCDVNFTCTVNT